MTTDNRPTIKVFTRLDHHGYSFKIGSIFPYAIIETEHDVITGERNSKIAYTWNWVCQGAGKQRRGKGNFKSIDAAKKALLKACGYNESSLNFVEVSKVAA